MTRSRSSWLVAGLAVISVTSAHAQPSPSAPITTPPAAPAHLAAGTPIIVELADTLSSKTQKRGDMFAIRLASPIELDGKVLAPAGSPGVGQVIDAASSGPLGRPAKLVLAARTLAVAGKPAPLR